MPFEQKRKVKGKLLSADGSPRVIYGVVYRLSQSYGFIRADLAGMEVYFEFLKEMEVLEALQKEDQVSFNLGFTMAGPCAIKVSPL